MIAKMNSINQKYIKSISLAHFITNDNPKYAKIKNIKTNKYLYVLDCKRIANTHDDYIFTPYQNCNINPIKIIGDNVGSIFCIEFNFNKKGVNLSFDTSILTQETCNEILQCEKTDRVDMIDDGKKLYLCKMIDNTNLHVTSIKSKSSVLFLDGNTKRLKMCSNFDEKNMYGEIGQYMFMSDDGSVHIDGDRDSEYSEWIFELINIDRTILDVRNDYVDVIERTMRDAKKSIVSIFPNVLKFFTLFNIECKQYLNIPIVNDDVFNEHVFGSNNKQLLVIQPDLENSCIYLSCFDGIRLRCLFTIPHSSDVYINAPKCDWAKFYIIKHNEYYIFRCNQTETDHCGNFGKYLCMCIDDNKDYIVRSDGSANDAKSKWIVAPV